MGTDDHLSRRLREIDATPLLAQRPARVPDWQREAEALGELTEAFATAPERIAQALADAALAMTGASAAGISLEEPHAQPQVFRWVATAGTYARYLNGTMPRHFSPCGEVLARDAPILMRGMDRLYDYVAALHAPPHEVLLVPFHQRGRPIGTVWIVSHDEQRVFDREDLRIVQTLTRFASAAMDNVDTVRSLTAANARQSAELAARADQIRELRGWFDLGPGLAAYVSGPGHSLVFANQPFRRLLGCEEWVGTPVAALGLALGGRELVDLLEQVHRTRRPFSGHGIALHVPDPDPGAPPAVPPSHVDVVMQPDLDAQGRVVGVFLHADDASDRVRAFEASRELDARKDRFMAVLAHEMRTPLSTISLQTQVIKRAGDDAARREASVASLERQAAQMTALVRDMTDVVAIRSGKLSLDRAPVTVQEVVAHALEAANERVRAKAQRLDVSLPAEPLWVDGDGVRLTQVLVNLLNNASKYTPEHGAIRVQAGRGAAGTVVVAVADSGVGIDAAELPKVFDMYMQVHMDHRPVDSGLGIGLALVKQLVELHGGSVTVASDGLGRGSTFGVVLPVLRGGG